ncbi:MAG: linear amide C-N hydrolase [Candidatus Bipolaricaulota bacterium]
MPARSCATFVIDAGGSVVAAHNLDESFPVPGLVVANPRGVAKWSVRFHELLVPLRARSTRRVRWTSKYGSLTWNVFGREFPDGGMNEAGLYVAEMTLLSTTWPTGRATAHMYHHQWIQYLLDNYASVSAALESLAVAGPEGHCRWHFLLADREGDVAVVEFLDGRAVIYRDEELPYRVLCNARYREEVDALKSYAGFGGSKDPGIREADEDPRFRLAVSALAASAGSGDATEFAFSLLDRLDLGTRKWATVCRLAEGKMLFRTSVAPSPRWIAMSANGFANLDRPLALDIHHNASGDVTQELAPLSARDHRRAVSAAWAEIDLGLLANALAKPLLVHGLARTATAFRSEQERMIGQRRTRS